MGFFDKLKRINIFNNYTKLTDDFYDELEESLILADMGVDTSLKAVSRLRERCESEKIGDTEKAKQVMREILADMLNVGDKRLILYSQPSIVLFIGVNGVGKTTTIGKIGNILKNEGKKVMFAAADTFRAAATEQLTIWAERCGVEIIKQGEGADPAAVVFDAINAANARMTDVVLVDTAGRLHNKTNLMNELNKIDRVIKRECPICSKETLLVLDAT
ncbi:MAG: signal recognition particle receptor subunit alpha, partial [Candidatus Onthomonas sp.]